MNNINFLKFTDGSDVSKDFNTVYKRHKKGYVILGPSGSGKTTFVNKQTGKNRHWIDSDMIMGSKSLNTQWQNLKPGSVDERLAYMRVDYMLEQCKMYGYRIIGALFWEYVADAIVIPPIEEHKKYVLKRKDLSIKALKKNRNIYFKHARKHNIPVFDNFKEAIDFLEKKK